LRFVKGTNGYVKCFTSTNLILDSISATVNIFIINTLMGL
jgi:hypothetical protein